jgi:hypothetical protein
MMLRVFVAGAALASLAGRLPAQAGPGLQTTGSVRGGYWSSTRSLDDRTSVGAAMVWLKTSAPVVRGAALHVEAWSAFRAPSDAPRTAAELREGYISASLGPVDLRAGRQIIAWGRADGVNPTGNLAAEDLTLLTPDDADRRIGTTALVASYYPGAVSITGVWLPEFRGHRIPLPAANGVSFVDDHASWPADQWALRVERTGGSIDWAASLFRGFDLTPDLGPSSAADQIALTHHRLTVFGIDAATTMGKIGVRAEAAYVKTEDRRGTDPFMKNPFVFVVVGGDRTIDGRFNLNVQYLLRAVIRFPGAVGDSSLIAAQQAIVSAQTTRAQHGGTIRASYKWLHETLEAEWAAVAYARPDGIAMRPKLSYAITDRVTVLVGGEVFRGENTSLFRLLRPNSLLFAESRWGF